jgi:hypothetical protein
MTINYSALYTDEFGTEPTTIFDDGNVWKMSLRGIEFSGGLFSLRASTNDIPGGLFNFFEDEICGYPIICGYSIDYQIPVQVISDNKELQTILHTHIECGKPVDASNRKLIINRNGIETKISRWIDQRDLSLEIQFEGITYKSSRQNNGNSFDSRLNELSKQFTPSVYLKICENCGLSEYPPNLIGVSQLRCFRNAKNEFRQVIDNWTNNWAFIDLWLEKGIDVNHTYLCPEFEKRKPYPWMQ